MISSFYLFLPAILTIFQRRNMQVLPYIFSEERGVGEAQDARNLLDRHGGRTKVVRNIGKRIFRNPLYRRLARMALADDGEILGRNTKLLGKVFHRTVLDFLLLQNLQEPIENITRTQTKCHKNTKRNA